MDNYLYKLFTKNEYNLTENGEVLVRYVNLVFDIQWNPSIVATIRDQPFDLYRGVATSQGLFYIIDKTCTCMV